MAVQNHRVQCTIKTILDSVFLAKKGCDIDVCWRRPAETYKKVTDKIEKMVCTRARVGVDYDNISDVQEKRANGELPAENAGIGHWAKWNWFPFIIEHKTTGQLYLRLSTSKLKNVKYDVFWFRNGVEVSAESVQTDLTAKEKKSGSNVEDCFNVKIESMVSVDTVEELV
jgi:hypothetical protein